MNIRGSVNMVRFCKLTWNNVDERLVLIVLITSDWKNP